MSRMNMLDSLDFGMEAKVRFVATVLPILGAIGGIIRIAGGSDEVALVVLVPLLFVAFFGSKYSGAIRKANLAEQQMWSSRDVRLREQRQVLIEAQQEDLRQLRLRQQAEQNRIMTGRPSTDQLKGMMERHRDEYEALLRRQSA
jgi:hypothetical protein